VSDAHALKPLEGWSIAFRSRFETRYDEHTWTVDVDFLDLGQRLRLYRDGIAAEVKRSPATFDVGPGAEIRASMGMLGMREVELVVDGHATTLAPADGTLEAWRVRLKRERPALSWTIGTLSWTVLVFALITGVAELIALTGLDPPLTLPGPLGTLLGIAALAAALERALRFKSNRWLD
jgi:hypothetical protein